MKEEEEPVFPRSESRSDVVDVWISVDRGLCCADTVVFVAHPWQEVTQGKWTRFAILPSMKMKN